MTTSSTWSKLLTEVTTAGNSWKIERKYRRILNKRLAGKVRTHVREQQEKIENAEKLAKNEQRLMAKEVAKMVQREFWAKVERIVVSKTNFFFLLFFFFFIFLNLFHEIKNTNNKFSLKP